MNQLCTLKPHVSKINLNIIFIVFMDASALQLVSFRQVTRLKFCMSFPAPMRVAYPAHLVISFV